MNMQLLNLLVSTCCLFLLLFATHLFFANKGNRLFNILLSVIFFSRFGQALTTLLITSKSLPAAAIIFQICTPLFYASPACFYLYIVCFTSDRNKLNIKEWLHFIPALLALIHIIPWHNSVPIDWPSLAKQLTESGYFALRAKSGLFPAYFQYVFRPLLVLTYLVLAWIELFGMKKKDRKNITKNDGDWILFFLKIATVFQTASLLPILIKGLHWPYSHTFFVALNCLMLLSLFAYTIHKPHIFYGYLLVAVDWAKKNNMEQIIDSVSENFQSTAILPAPVKHTRKLNLPQKQGEDYALLMKNLMDDEAVYLNPDLQIIDVASKLNLPMHHCSFVLNNVIGKNFRDWINSYRIEYFLNQYPIKGNKITIEAIARESGFKSLATFYNAFKKEKGSMPKVYFNVEGNPDSTEPANNSND